jgi:hypothetical protein
MEAFWAPYREGGPLSDRRPSNAQYLVALNLSLLYAGICVETATQLTFAAGLEQIFSGAMPWHQVPKVPNAIGGRVANDPIKDLRGLQKQLMPE